MKMRSRMGIIGAVGVLCVWLIACASAPSRQTAVITLQGVSRTLNTLQDAELAAEAKGLIPGLNKLASPATTKLCPAGIPLAVPTANHNVIQCYFVVVFTAIKQASVDLMTWAVGMPVPSALQQVKDYAAELVTLVKGLLPADGGGQSLLTQAQAMLDAVLAVAGSMGVTL